MTRLDLSLILAAAVAKLPRRKRKVDPLLLQPPLTRETWRDLFPTSWAPFYSDTATAAGDRAYRERAEFQRTCTCHGPGPRHAAREDIPRVRPGWVALDVTQEFHRIVSSLGEVAA